ncbi:MAG: oxidoreductase [Rhodobacteraceae bacterium]|nr:MAG: oxidoreductase [Paracoccaceae bacterium]
MSEVATEKISLQEIYDLAFDVFSKYGCNQDNATALSRIVHNAERDGSLSHGLFRVPGYVASLKSGKVKGEAEPNVKQNLPTIISVDGDYGFAPYALEVGLPVLAKAAEDSGIAILKISNSFHFAALWPETEFLAEKGLIGIACTAAKPMVAPAGAKKAFFGTNPLSFAWPRKESTPIVFDMATSTLAMGDVQIAARDGHAVPPGTGLGPDGNPSDDPQEIIKGVLLPFGGYKGSAISLMVELLSAGLTGDNFSYEAGTTDNNDGGPPKGGELIIAISPALVAGNEWSTHSEMFLKKLKNMEGVRIPGERRHKNRLDQGPRFINKAMLDKVKKLLE